MIQPGANKENQEEEEGFYTKLFDSAISSVLEEENHLVNHTIIEKYKNVPKGSKKVFCNLLNRKHKWLKLEAILNGMTIQETIHSVDILIQAGLILEFDFCSRDELANGDIHDVFCTMVKDDLVAVAKKMEIKLNSKMKKDEIQQTIKNSCLSKADQVRLMGHISLVLGRLIKQDSLARFECYLILLVFQRLKEWPENDNEFMLNSIRSNLDETDARKLNFVGFTMRTGLIWLTRADLDNYVKALQLERQVTNFSESKQWKLMTTVYFDNKEKWSSLIKISDPTGHITGIPFFSTFTEEFVLTRMFSNIYYAFFRLKDYKKATLLLGQLLDQRKYCGTKRGYWWDELVRLTDIYGCKKEALQLSKEALADPLTVTHHRLSIFRRLGKLAKIANAKPIVLRDAPNFNPVPDPYIIHGVPNRKSVKDGPLLFLDQEGKNIRVENLVLNYFVKDGWKGLHCENSIFTTLFGLLFWDIIFDTSIPGVFPNIFQAAPLDMNTAFFYESRSESINSRIEEIRNGQAIEIIQRVADVHQDQKTVCIGVSWDLVTIEELLEITLCMKNNSLAAICSLFAKRYWANRKGLPDLCIWNIDKYEMRLIEVKSESDRLSDAQIVWLDILRRAEFDATVALVKDTSKVKKARLK